MKEFEWSKWANNKSPKGLEEHPQRVELAELGDKCSQRHHCEFFYMSQEKLDNFRNAHGSPPVSG